MNNFFTFNNNQIANTFTEKINIAIIKIFVVFNYKIDVIKNRQIKIEKIKFFCSLMKDIIFIVNNVDEILRFL